MIVEKEDYNPKQNYYFVDYSLEEHGHPEYIERMKKDDPSHPDMGSPRWVRSPMQTEQDVQETMNFVFAPFPHKVKGLQIRSEEELNEIITIDEKTHKQIWEHEDKDAFKKGLKLTQREYDFGSNYQKIYEYTVGLLDDNFKPIKKQKVKSKKKVGK
jgi:hypothetical protein